MKVSQENTSLTFQYYRFVLNISHPNHYSENDCFIYRKVHTQLQKNLLKHEARRKKECPQKVTEDRDMASKFYGDHLDPNELFKFKMPEGKDQSLHL